MFFGETWKIIPKLSSNTHLEFTAYSRPKDNDAQSVEERRSVDTVNKNKGKQFEEPKIISFHLKPILSKSVFKYRNDPKFSDRQVWANSADPDQEQSDQGLHCLQFPLHLLDALL